jgi:centrosomal protein CEP135
MCRRLKETIAAKDREIVSLRRQLDAGNDELTDVGRSREVALRENRRLQDDLALMTRENQVGNWISTTYTLSAMKLV